MYNEAYYIKFLMKDGRENLEMKLKVGNLSKLLNVSTNTVRRYENLGYISSHRSEENGYRYFNEADIIKFINARHMRKIGFSHPDISKIFTYGIDDLRGKFNERLSEIDQQIEYLTNLRHCLKDDIGMMDKIDIYEKQDYIRDCVPLYYVLYQDGENLLMEDKRLSKVWDFLYKSPEVHHIFIIKKEDVESEDIILKKGWAIKIADLDKYKIEKNNYVELYEKKKSLLRLAKLPVKNDNVNSTHSSYLKDILLNESMQYLNDHNLKLDGDIIGISIAIVIENNIEMQYVLVSLPIAEK